MLTQPVEEVLPQMERRLGLIVLSHVLEHLLDPHTVLRLVHASLAPGGVLHIEVPNISVESLLLYPDHVWARRIDELHITFFSVSTLRNLLESAGVELRFCDTAGPEYKYIFLGFSKRRYELVSLGRGPPSAARPSGV